MSFKELQQLTFSWGTVRLCPAAPYRAHYTERHHIVGLAFDRQRGTHRFASDRVVNFDAWPNTLAFTPSGMETFSESPDCAEYLVVQIRPRALEPELARGTHLTLRREWPGDRRAGILARSIRAALLQPAWEPLRVESLAVQLTQHAANLLACSARTIRRYSLDRHRLSAVLELIEARLGEPLSLNELAQLAQLPRYRFLRSFTAATGLTPHAFVVGRRLHRARQLLENSDASLTEVALACGFAHQAHMTALFTRALALAPGSYRRRAEALRL
jgi:AraC-like DNA-binding protein